MNPMRVLVLDDHRQEPGELVELAPQVGVEQRVVALAPAPQHVVVATEAVGGLEAVGDLGGRVGEHLGVGVGRRARPGSAGWRTGWPCPTAAARRCAPGARRPRSTISSSSAADSLNDAALGRDVAVVEAVEGHAELGEELERRGHLLAGRLQRVGRRRERRVPRAVERPGAEDVEAVPVERVPVADGEPQVVLHPPAGHDAVGVVPVERQRVVAVGTLVRDPLGDLGEELGHRVPAFSVRSFVELGELARRTPRRAACP